MNPFTRFYNTRTFGLFVVVIMVAVAIAAMFFANGNIRANVQRETTTTTINPAMVVCVYVPNAQGSDITPKDGHTIEYSGDGTWSVDGKPIGWAMAEDEPFEACSDKETMSHFDVTNIGTACQITRDGNQWCNEPGDIESPVQTHK